MPSHIWGNERAKAVTFKRSVSSNASGRVSSVPEVKLLTFAYIQITHFSKRTVVPLNHEREKPCDFHDLLHFLTE